MKFKIVLLYYFQFILKYQEKIFEQILIKVSPFFGSSWLLCCLNKCFSAQLFRLDLLFQDARLEDIRWVKTQRMSASSKHQPDFRQGISWRFKKREKWSKHSLHIMYAKKNNIDWILLGLEFLEVQLH